MTLRLFGALAAAALAAGCGGMGDDSQPTYRDVLMERYPPIERAMEAAVEPCLSEDLPECSRHYGEAKEHAEMLLAELEEVEPPAGLEQADTQFRRGLTDIAELLGEAVAAAGAGDEEAVARLHMEQHEALIDVNNPLGLFNDELDMKLRPH